MSVSDNLYLVRTDASGYIMYIGDKGTKIEYNPAVREWHMRSGLYPNVSASSKAPFHTLSFGVQNWMVTNDIECQEGEAQFNLSISSCSMSVTHTKHLFRDQGSSKDLFTNYPEEFICHDGLCVDLERRCNGFVDCQVMTLLFRSAH